jgi:glutamine amidotransferase
MCRLFAVSGKDPVRVNDIVREFYKGSYLHRHGWGYADFTNGKAVVKREAGPAYESKYLEKLLAAPFYVRTALFHIRYATVGAVETDNAHPMSASDLTGRDWRLIHNGTIFDFDKIDEFFYRQTGSTDSERLLLYIVDRINRETAERKGPLSAEERFAIVERALKDAAPGNKLNIILYDGELLYVHANSRTGGSLLGDAGKDDFLYEAQEGGTRYFSTAAIGPGNWTPIRLNTLTAYRDGGKLFEGTPHGDEYFESEEDVRQMYRGFSAL